MTKLFQGLYTAIVTPFTEDDKIDWNAFEKIIDIQISSGVDGIVFVGTTGESPTLSYEEHFEILTRSVEMINGRCQVIQGTGSNDTAVSIKTSEIAAKAGADGQLIVSPYYNKPTQEGLYLHFTTVADATDLPVIVYNIKGRTGVNIETPTLMRMAEHENIVGVKEASGDIAQMMDVIRKAPDDFCVLVGDDSYALPFIAAGGDGLISVISNCMPRSMSEMVKTCLSGDFAKARQQFYKLLDVMKISFIETNPIPVKEMMGLLGYCSPSMRLPLTKASKESIKAIKDAVEIIKEIES